MIEVSALFLDLAQRSSVVLLVSYRVSILIPPSIPYSVLLGIVVIPVQTACC
jgi:hypothetical protein